ncbi:hypothetical protein J3454_14385 [Erythrobacter sp. NFXS35]|uniref:hypothetical protein n=1 Tax=Erythrobacter sp. NFXS35 TaxID=2818436 RepID=UPI0032DFD7C3
MTIKLRHRNVAMRFKIETTEGTDASPDATNAFPFEVDGYEYNSPFRAEGSQEANGSMAASAPLVIGQAADISIRVRMKGAGAGSTYAAEVKPPHHDLLAACGWRGLFNAAVAATALAAGTTSAATLATPFSSTAQTYRGLPLVLSGGSSGGRIAHVSDYTGARVASLTDLFGTALDTEVTAALPANWSYAPTSPADATARASDHPSGTLYIYEDGVLRKFFGLRGMVDFAGETARPGFMTFRFMGIYGGKTDVARVSDSVPQHVAPILAMGTGGVTPSVVIDRKSLAVRNWALGTNQQMEVSDDPNTSYGFGASELAGRAQVLTLDPIETLVANRDVIADIENGTRYTGVIRCGTVAGNRWSIALPLLQPAQASPGRRGIFRTEELSLNALNPGAGPSTRDSEATLCFY